MGANVAATTRTAIFGRGTRGEGNKTSGTLISDSRNREHEPRYSTGPLLPLVVVGAHNTGSVSDPAGGMREDRDTSGEGKRKPSEIFGPAECQLTECVTLDPASSLPPSPSSPVLSPTNSPCHRGNFPRNS